MLQKLHISNKYVLSIAEMSKGLDVRTIYRYSFLVCNRMPLVEIIQIRLAHQMSLVEQFQL